MTGQALFDLYSRVFDVEAKLEKPIDHELMAYMGIAMICQAAGVMQEVAEEHEFLDSISNKKPRKSEIQMYGAIYLRMLGSVKQQLEEISEIKGSYAEHREFLPVRNAARLDQVIDGICSEGEKLRATLKKTVRRYESLSTRK